MLQTEDSYSPCGGEENHVDCLEDDMPPSHEQDSDSEMTNLEPLLCRLNNSSLSPRTRMEQEKRIRREIANSNERRRMQSINVGFQSLKALLPKRDGEKMSKASILQQTAQFMRTLQAEKTQLLQQNLQYKHILESRGPQNDVLVTVPVAPKHASPPVPMLKVGSPDLCDGRMRDSMPLKKRRKFDSATESPDEGISVTTDTDSESKTSSPQLPQTPAVKACGETNTNSVNNLTSMPTKGTPTARAPSSFQQPTLADGYWELDMLKRELIELRLALERERRSRLILEDHLRGVVDVARIQPHPLQRLTSNSLSLLDYSAAAASLLSVPVGLGGAIPGHPASSSPESHLVAPVNSPTPSGFMPLCARGMAPSTRAAPVPPNTAARKHSIESLVALGSAASPPKSSGHVVCPKPTYTIPSSAAPVAVSQAAAHAQLVALQGGHVATKQNLEAIVEAIRHLEGDQLFVDTDCRKLLSAGMAERADSGVRSPAMAMAPHLIGYPAAGLRTHPAATSVHM